MTIDAFLAAAAIFLQVALIDIALAGDNAVVIGMAAARLPPPERRKAIVIGIGFATVLRIGLAAVATMLLAIVGLLLAGGILLLWVCWKMWRELRFSATSGRTAEALLAEGEGAPAGPRKTLKQAVLQIVLADVSMSLDNVLAVAGAARENPVILVFGLGLSVVLMGFAAAAVARLLNRHRWIAYAGLLIILAVAVEMIWRGAEETAPFVARALAG